MITETDKRTKRFETLADDVFGKRPGVSFIDYHDILGDYIEMEHYMCREDNGTKTIVVYSPDFTMHMPLVTICAGVDVDGVLEALRMRTQHYALRSYGRMYDGSPTERLITLLQKQIKEQADEILELNRMLERAYAHLDAYVKDWRNDETRITKQSESVQTVSEKVSSAVRNKRASVSNGGTAGERQRPASINGDGNKESGSNSM